MDNTAQAALLTMAAINVLAILLFLFRYRLWSRRQRALRKEVCEAIRMLDFPLSISPRIRIVWRYSRR